MAAAASRPGVGAKPPYNVLFPSIIFKYFLTVGTDNPVRLAISFFATPLYLGISFDLGMVARNPLDLRDRGGAGAPRPTLPINPDS